METTKKAMIVDDSKLTQKQLAQIFAACGIEVVDFASNGQEAVEKYGKLRDELDIITLDITMPVLDGLSVLKKVLEIDSSAKVVMVSALGKESIIKTCMMTGARNFIIKPFHADKVKEIILNVVAA